MGLIERLKNSWEIFKLSFRIIKKDKSLVIVPIILIFGAALLIIPLLVIGIVAEITINHLVAVALVYILASFFVTFLLAAQSWMVYEVVQDKDTTLSSGLKRAAKNFFDILLFVLASFVLMLISNFLRGKGKVGEFAAGTLDFFAGIAKRLILPAMIITERHFGQAVVQLKDSLKAIPEIATYEIGIRPLTTIAFIASLVLSVLFFLMSPILGIIIFLSLMLLLVITNIYVNTTYYTLVYLALIEKKKIKELQILK